MGVNQNSQQLFFVHFIGLANVMFKDKGTACTCCLCVASFVRLDGSACHPDSMHLLQTPSVCVAMSFNVLSPV